MLNPSGQSPLHLDAVPDPSAMLGGEVGIRVAPAVLPATGRPRGNVVMGLATSMGTGSSKLHRLAANADESELRLDIPLHAERILILNYYLIHWGWLPARKPHLQGAVFVQSAGEPGNLPTKRQLRWARRHKMDGSDGTRRRQTPGMLPLHEQMRLRREFRSLQSARLGTRTGQPHRRRAQGFPSPPWKGGL